MGEQIQTDLKNRCSEVMKKNTVILMEILLIIPYLVTILNYKAGIDLFNGILIFFGLDTRDSHLLLGEWFLIFYTVSLPVGQFILFFVVKYIFGVDVWCKEKVWLFTLACAIPAAYMYIEGIVIVSW